MGSLLDLALIVGVVAGAALALGWLARRPFGPGSGSRRRGRPAPSPSPRRPLEEVAADLRRLARQSGRVAAGTPMTRRRALQAAYDDLLVEAALLLGIPAALGVAPEGIGRDGERLSLEAALAAAGLEVR